MKLRVLPVLLCLSTLSSCSSIEMLSALDTRSESAPRPIELSSEELQEAIEDEGVETAKVGQEVPREEDLVVDLDESSEDSDIKFNPYNAIKNLVSSDSEDVEEGRQVASPKFELDYLPEHFDFWLDYYIRRDKSRFQRQLTQGEAYRDIVKKTMKANGLPEELFYVGLIESGYNMHIRSHASAVGPWQFIKGTALRYGMRVNHQVDERRNIHKATKAAAGYFKDLYNIFGSWELALCAYNAGEYRVINAIRKGKTRSYTELVQKKLLPRETIYYVPKLAAAMHLSQNREKYGLSVLKQEDDFYINASEVFVKGSFSLEDLAKNLKLEIEDVEKLNPDFKYKVVQAPRSGQRVIVPLEKIEVAKSLKLLNRKVAQGRNSGEKTHYKVRRGDNLISISRKFGVSVQDLRRLNNIRGSKILLGQTLQIDGPSTKTYTVRRGDNLGRIARLHRTTVSDLRRLNNLKGSRILVSQKLKVPNAVLQTYTVRRGDNLAKIAQKFNTSIANIVQMNSLKGTRIYPNQKIRIPSDG